MPKPNYRFDKRQREMKKAQQLEEKRLKKLARAAQPPADGSESAAQQAPDDAEDSRS
ncbi:MAG: hypothetical protein ACPHN2_16275 [Sinimarinibacterium flocculans]|uniref:Uncharacterized protein n=1 Tax=Sinimarinibacterium flocculans TaxID=985250 RepID=A0A318ECR8_9GAMM|nr:hypothetical protein [Sinimarinibacterium flocculans]PXV70271.1 hypothetical protein C8D93_102123 [Sinimarinibacterium flocculans]